MIILDLRHIFPPPGAFVSVRTGLMLRMSRMCLQYQLLTGHLGGLDRTRRPYVQMYCTYESCFRVDVNVARGIQQMLSIDQQKANIAPHLAIQKMGAMYQ
jgi:hypothetical protein